MRSGLAPATGNARPSLSRRLPQGEKQANDEGRDLRDDECSLHPLPRASPNSSCPASRSPSSFSPRLRTPFPRARTHAQDNGTVVVVVVVVVPAAV